MKKSSWIILISCILTTTGYSQHKLDSILPVRGICMAAPSTDGVDTFIDFVKNELVTRQLNTMVLRIDYRYQYKSHPELVADGALSEEQVKKIVIACRKGGIKIIPQVNMLGHQSWYANVGKLLQQYPQFNETPEIPLDQDIDWPNEWGLYCLSYCPLHPEVHEIVFAVIDEIVEVFEAEAFHAGMDEVFFLGMDERCKGRDPAELFAGEVTAIRNHLALNDKKLWIWGDRLIDGKTTGIGLWEGSYNNTHRAIDLIPKDVVINDWHYERPDPTAAYFALKGFNVITCPWRFPEVTVEQLHMMLDFREGATPGVKDNYQGMMQTVWTSAENTIEQFYGRQDANNNRGGNWVEVFKALYDEIDKVAASE
jgi:hypothetical protein